MDAHTDLPDWRRTERQRLIAAREGVPAGQRAARNGAITDLLDQGFPALRRLIVGFCWPYRGEFDARFLIRTLRSAGARAALPDVAARATPLVFREWWPGVAMTKRVFDLPVPDGTAVVQPQALLIPLVVLLSSTLITSAMTITVDWWYPLRVMFTACALILLWRHYRGISFRITWFAVAVGVLVFLLWLLVLSLCWLVLPVQWLLYFRRPVRPVPIRP